MTPRQTTPLATVTRVILMAIALGVLPWERSVFSQVSAPPADVESSASRSIEERLERIETMLNELLRRVTPDDEAAPRTQAGDLHDGLWRRGFLPAQDQDAKHPSTDDSAQLLSDASGQPPEERRRVLDHLKQLNEARLAESGDSDLQTRIAQYERAYRMQAAAQDLPIGTALQDWGRKDASLPGRELSALQVYDRFSLNHALADEQVGQRLRVRGYVSTIRRKVEAETTGYILQMPADREGAIQAPPHLHFEFQQEDRKALADVVPGRMVTVEGQYTRSESGEIHFTDCKLITVNENPIEKAGP